MKNILSKSVKTIIAALVVIFISINTRAEGLRLHGLFTDNMVLQQQSEVSVWGWADAGAKVTVTASWTKEKYAVTVSQNGTWMVKVATPSASYDAQTLAVACGKEKVTLSNVLIGEVWVCSGQSNMEMPLKGFGGQPVEGGIEAARKSAVFKGIRSFKIPLAIAEEPCDDVPKGSKGWMVSCPENALNFSAVAYFYGVALNQVLDVPIGLLVDAWGGAGIQAFMPKSLLEKLGYKNIDTYFADEKLQKQHKPMGIYNAMIHPVINYTVKGFIWYQGCTNTSLSSVHKVPYAVYQTEMLAQWRRDWGLGDLPFYYVELAPYPTRDNYAYQRLREQQRKALDMSANVGMATTVDLYYDYETVIHPCQKKPVGERLAWIALDKTYGVKGMCSGYGEYKSFKQIEPGKVEVTFNVNYIHAAGEPGGFEVAGPDRVFHPASASIIKRSKVVLECPEVPEIVAVRYCFNDCHRGVNFLYSDNSLPIRPFRTDDWE